MGNNGDHRGAQARLGRGPTGPAPQAGRGPVGAADADHRLTPTTQTPTTQTLTTS
ncbi:hypothetical protein [Streptomyces rimosus]|uniref:hypothetical protein n=1 Tax=Streptomyces rimosus TaxID=1927 RepID=UPI0037A1D54C